jgi:hypothetical protein
MIIKITWDFSETEYSDVGHKLAAESLSLPTQIDSEFVELDEDLVLCEEDIKDFLYEKYCFEVKKVKFVEE